MNKSKYVAFYGILICLAMVLSWVEAQIPVFFAIPGMKLGLTNVVVVTALYGLGEKSGITINLIRIILVSFLFGNGVSLVYSMAGGLLSGLVMVFLKRTKWFGMITVSVLGGIFHNIGQILAAMCILRTASLAWYLPVLWFTGMSAGGIIGIISYLVCQRLMPMMQEMKK